MIFEVFLLFIYINSFLGLSSQCANSVFTVDPREGKGSDAASLDTQNVAFPDYHHLQTLVKTTLWMCEEQRGKKSL